MHRPPAPPPRVEAHGCPKSMVHGPCGGVEADGGCEVAAHRCVFLDVPTVRWRGTTAAPSDGLVAHPAPAAPVVRPSPPAGAAALRARLGTVPVVVADLPGRALDADSITAVGRLLGGRVDAVLLGDAGGARLQLPPAYRARLVADAGMTPWAGVNCRDRNRVAIEAELAALAHAGAAGVHCVTGDHTLVGSRPDAQPVFDLDSTELAALAASYGHLVSVAEAPATPPVDRRAARLVEKVRAGAEVCFVDHCGGAAAVAAFADELAGLGVRIPLIACVPLVIDAASAAMLRTFTGLVLPPGYLDTILGAADPRAGGVSGAVALSAAMLRVPGVVGVDLSGGGSDPLALASAMAEVADGTR